MTNLSYTISTASDLGSDYPIQVKSAILKMIQLKIDHYLLQNSLASSNN